MHKFQIYIYFIIFSLFFTPSCKKNDKKYFKFENNSFSFIQLSGSIQSSETHQVYPPENSRITTIENIIEEGSLIKKGDFIAELIPQKNNDEILNKKQKIDQILQEKTKSTQETNAQIQKNINDINKNIADIDLFNKTRATQNISSMAEFIPLNNLKKELIDNKINLISVKMLKEQNNYLQNKLNIYKNNYDKRENILQKNIPKEENLKKFIIKSDADGIIYFLKNWQGEKFIKSSTAYESVPFAQIENTEKIQVVSYLPEENRKNAYLGKAVKVIIFGSQNIEVGGTIKSISKIVMTLKNWDTDLDKGKATSVDPLFFQMVVNLNSLPKSLKPQTKVQVLL